MKTGDRTRPHNADIDVMFRDHCMQLGTTLFREKNGGLLAGT